ncbi:DUF4861 domain-containing protein [Rufibacter hautae]|uniref:DUF4861 domain-containing protein n=1 Tax=Rufibacter hautae TaxID=2595005 RepID=A0A5B6THW3_9BACT|nr:DUF4861 domain-containing protein [Rufibacter hautae]KAA3439586.1 DUF4861 domain-containing protein [Rufibacter hautae]
MVKSFQFKRTTWAGLFLAAGLLASCQKVPGANTITVQNRLDLDRSSETITIPVARVRALVNQFGAENLLIRDAETQQVLVSQPLDKDLDGTIDEILFQTDIKAKATKKFYVQGAANGAASQPKTEVRTYSRFVPERTDDYTWENDRVAFRTYGPVAQQMVEKGVPGGTLTSGMDAWLKRVSYSVIDAWYKGYLGNPNFYHTDRGEGYDPYHVGPSRGIGGLGVWENDSLYVSRNFVSYRKIADGPIRTMFELTYAPWQANGKTVTEKKTISLDLGSNLSRFEVAVKSDKPLPNVTAGITLHDKKGEVKGDKAAGWFRYWEPMDDSFLGTGIVMVPAAVQAFKDHRVETKDMSHLYVMATPKEDKVLYFAGFAWVKSGQFKTEQEWDAYLSDFAKRMASPLEVTF